jgi:hypothetical protein
MEVRDKQGHFAPGTCGGPGRPSRQTEKSYLRVLMQNCTLDDWRTIVARAVTDAKDGDAAARQWLGRYLCGCPDKSAPSPLDLEIEAAAGSEDREFDNAVLFRRTRSV